MEQSQIPEWNETYRKQVEEILREKFKGLDFSDEERGAEITKALELLDMIDQVERPQGVSWIAVRAILHLAIKDNTPLVSAMAGFQLGVAYEKLQNAKRA